MIFHTIYYLTETQSHKSTRKKKTQTKYLKFSISPKAKEINFKILNGVYPSSEILRQRFEIGTNKRVFCDDIETTNHLFFKCMYSEAFWLDLHNWFNPRIFQRGMNFSCIVILKQTRLLSICRTTKPYCPG